MELRFNNQQKYLIFDAETEGLNLATARPWQLAWIESVGKKIINKNNFLIDWPDLNISPDAARISGFDRSYYDLHKYPPPLVLGEFLKPFLDKDVVIVGQNILNYDVYIINNLMRGSGVPNNYEFIYRCIDTRALFMAYKNGLKYNHNEDFIIWQYKIIGSYGRSMKSSLPTMLKEFNIPYDANKLHDALYDIERTFDVYNHLIYKFDV